MKFSSQLQQIMTHFNLGTTELADKILVPKATISHLISERNKPSLEFIMKLHTHFPSLNLEWLIYGKDPFLVSEKATFQTSGNEVDTSSIFQKQSDTSPFDNGNLELENKTNHLFDEQHPIELTPPIKQEEEIQIKENIENRSISDEKILSFPKTNKSIENIVIFYSDGSFKSYKPE